MADHPNGPTTIARLLRGENGVDLAALQQPWRGIAEKLRAADSGDHWQVLMDAGPEVVGAILATMGRLDTPPPGNGQQSTMPANNGYHTTDLGNALRFVDRHGDIVRYCYPEDLWYWWNEKRFVEDDTGEIERLAKDTVREIYAEAGRAVDEDARKALAKWAMRSESKAKVGAMIYLARSELPIPVLPAEFDADPWLLNVANGTIDLRTGQLGPHRREDLLTQLAPVAYDPSATLPLWERFLDETTGGDQELQRYLQRAVGYTLTGRTDAEHLFFVYGPTRTGKSTFLEAIKGALGDYAKTSDFGTFLKGHTVGKPRADIARLRGARMVISIEVDEGSHLAEALLKMLTGGDTITARALYRDSFEFRPAFKLWLAANDAPDVSAKDGAIWERIRRVPFMHAVPKEKRDPQVKEKLRDPEIGGPAILAWAVQGCLAWQREGLGSCAAVERSTKAYRDEMDNFSGFVEECCVLAAGAWVSAKELRKTYEAWGAENGTKKLVQGKEWGQRLRDLGCDTKSRWVVDHTERGWIGIGLLGEPVQEQLSDR